MNPDSKLPGLHRLIAGILTLTALNGCMPITTQVAGWPQDLMIRAHYDAGFIKVQEKCYPSIPLPYKLMGGIALECAVIDLAQKFCDIYTIAGEASEHELSHCRGGDHDGLLQDYFNRWKRAHEKQIAPELAQPGTDRPDIG